MISSRELRDRLTERPFRPFRVYSSDGSMHDVPHPEFAWVFGNSLYVGKTGDLPFGMDDYAKQLSILHLTRVEPLPPKDKPRKPRRRRA